MTAPTRIRTEGPAVAAAKHLPVGRVIAASLATGAGSAAVVVFGVLPSAAESTIVGAALIAFALGWAMLAWLTARSTAFPQPWALVPAASLAVAGVVLMVARPGEPTMTQLAWVWAPALVALGLFVALRSPTETFPAGRADDRVPRSDRDDAGWLQVASTRPSTPSPETAAGTMPGRLVDVGGYRLHLSCSGTGSPTVVLLNGLGETSPQWERVNSDDRPDHPGLRVRPRRTGLERRLSPPRGHDQRHHRPAPPARRCR